jgi:hypothetical protein
MSNAQFSGSLRLTDVQCTLWWWLAAGATHLTLTCTGTSAPALEYTRRVLAPQSAAAFGCVQDGLHTAVVHTGLVAWVKALLTQAGFDASLFAGHSFLCSEAPRISSWWVCRSFLARSWAPGAVRCTRSNWTCLLLQKLAVHVIGLMPRTPANWAPSLGFGCRLPVPSWQDSVCSYTIVWCLLADPHTWLVC